tara:strand:- start:43326 stop:44009 length:684 start_codon:yes stop_codon:yes gene_type:complete
MSCGEEAEQPGLASNVGNIFYAQSNDFLDTTETKSLDLSCKALDAKEETIRTLYLSTGDQFVYSLQEFGCGEEEYSTAVQKTAELVSNGGSLSLDNDDLYFTDILTSDSDDVVDHCPKALNSERILRTRTVGSIAKQYTLLKSTHTNCNGVNGDPDQVCLVVNTGVRQVNSNAYKVTTVDKYVINLDIASGDTSYGMVLERERITSSGCDEDNQTKARKQKFESINK